MTYDHTPVGHDISVQPQETRVERDTLIDALVEKMLAVMDQEPVGQIAPHVWAQEDVDRAFLDDRGGYPAPLQYEAYFRGT